VCTGTPVHYEQTVREEVATTDECAQVHRYTMSKQSGRRMWRVCTDTPVYYEARVRDQVASPGWTRRQVCKDTPVHCEHTIREQVVRPGRTTW